VRNVRIVAIDGECASDTLDDGTLARQLGVNVEDVARRSRGLFRASSPDGEGPAMLASRVARRVLASAGVGTDEVDMVVFATTTPDITFPGSACLLQATLSARKGSACVDVRSQCTGFLSALDVARRFVACGTYARVLVAAADVPTHMLRYDGRDPELAMLAGDGAAVALVAAGSGTGSILSCVAKIDGRRYEQFWCEFPASRHLNRRGVARGERVTREAYESGAMYPRVDFAALREAALHELPGSFDRALRDAGLDAVDVAIIAHISLDVEDELREELAPRVGRFVTRRATYSFGSTLPLALADAVAAGELRTGETVAITTAGAGASWGTAVLQW
jgi:3-oxoacyl-[acyl-carrier-protein] synthase-3